VSHPSHIPGPRDGEQPPPPWFNPAAGDYQGYQGYHQAPQGWGPPPAPQNSSGLAIASIILGIVGLALAWVPIVNYIAMVLGLIALVLGGVGIFKSHRMMSIAGAVLGLVAIVASLAVYAAFVNSLNSASGTYAGTTNPFSAEVEGEGYPLGEEEALEGEAEANADEEAPPSNERGNLVKGIGELAGVGGLERGVHTAVWSIDGIETGIDCTEPYQSAEPEGHLTTVDLNLSTGPDWDEYTGGYGYVSPSYFTFIDSKGVTHSDLETIATYSCLPESQTFNDGSLGAGQNFTGKIILDLPDTEGTLVFTPSWDIYNTSGWEYPVG
jgi:hypothetical protein